MKEIYEAPVSLFEEFSVTDVITTSGTTAPATTAPTESTTKVGVDEEGWVDKWY